MNFNELNISEEVKHAVTDMGFDKPTDIQAESIPLILEGKDVIGYSQTGSGKTAAFGLPAIEFADLNADRRMPQILIMCPTRELAMQAAEELRKFAKYKEKLHIVCVYGGQPIERQIAQLKSGCQIVIGTPGRIMDHMRRKTLKFSQLKTVILDEADEMLNMGFREDIETILSETPDERQTILFSATMPKEIIEITGRFQKDPVMVKIKSKQMTAVNIEQTFYEVARGRKKDALSLLLQYYSPRLSLVFCNTKKMVDEVVADLQYRGFSAEGLHGDMKQMQRTQVMNRFKNGGFDILVATDVASRGIDVNDIDIVFNFDLPDESEYYIHRIGRTARAGKNGKSITLIQGNRQFDALQSIARYTKSEISKKQLPRVADIEEKNSGIFVDQIIEFVKNNDCNDCLKEYGMLIENGLEEQQIICALIKMFKDEKVLKKGTVDVPVEISKLKFKDSRYDRHSKFDDRKDGKRGADRRRKDRYPNEKAKKKFENVEMSSITISIGRNDKVAPKHILGAVAGESGLPGSMMGTIDIHKNYTTVDVPKEHKKRIIKALNHKEIKGRKVNVK